MAEKPALPHISQTFPCFACGAEDCRDKNHMRGCPYLHPVSPGEMRRLSALVIEGWAGQPQKLQVKGALGRKVWSG